MPAVPEWWSEVTVNYSEGTTLSNKWTRLKEMEASINEMVHKGISPVRERREMIKYLNLWRLKDRAIWRIEIAETYERLGDYRRSAREHAEIVSEDPGDLLLYGLAIEYERVGDREAALQLYNYMAKSFKSGSDGARIAMRGIACLSGVTNDCILKKPDWWSQYQSPPAWWADVPVTFPEISCFEDGYDFIVHSTWEKEDPRKLVKAWILLSEFKPITFNEEMRVLMSIGHAYSEIGDHHRAIEWAWTIPERFPVAISDTTIAIKFIASEFEKLGELDHAQEVRKGLSQ
jgi:hypothetical protein